MTADLDLLKALCPRGNVGIMNAVALAMEKYLPQYGIASPLRLAHFVAQAAHESDGFKTLTEYASGKAYEGRKDLGNVFPGDGVKYKGRGIFQCTGRANYEAYGRKLSLDLIGTPTLAASPEVSVRIACEYWKAKGLNGWADRDDVTEITRRINGGHNGLAQRKAYLDKAKALLNAPDAAPVAALMAPVHEDVPDAPIAAEAAKPWWQSTEVLAQIGAVLTSVGTFAASPWGVATIALFIIAGFAGWTMYRRMQREGINKPVIS
jgi:putative chitinase